MRFVYFIISYPRSASVSLFPTGWTAYHSDRSFSKRTGTDHRDLLIQNQDQLRCDLPAHHSDPDFLIPRPDQGLGIGTIMAAFTMGKVSA